MVYASTRVGEHGMLDIDAECRRLGLVNISSELVWRFAKPAVPVEPKIFIHRFAKANGKAALKCKCKNHSECVCWVGKALDTNGQQRLLAELWGRQGFDQTEYGHYVAAWR